jgi:branched-chain amino acid transport system ATP-binding protein
VVLNFGEVIADGTPEQVFDDPEVRRSYTGEGDA